MITVLKANLPSDSLLIQAAEKMEPKLRQAFLNAIAALKDQVDIDALTAAIASGDVGQVLHLLNIQNTLSGILQGKGLAAGVQSMQDVLQATFAAGAQAAMFSLPTNISVGISFNLMNPKTTEFLNNYTFNMIQQVSQVTRDQVQQVVLNAFTNGGHPFEQAREIKQFIGLTAQQEAAVNNYRSMLSSGGASDLREALTRSLRDGRYDRSLLSALRSGQSLPQDKIDAMTERYRQRYLQYRAQNIARTESIRASNKGQRALWHDAVDQGLMSPDTEREWEISGDEDTCPECEALDGTTAGLDEEFAPGILDPPDPHTSCRCNTKLIASTMKRAA